MQIKTTKRYHSYPLKWPSLKRQEIANAGVDVERKNPYTLLVKL